MNVDWKVISHKEQRYETSADWYWSDDGETLHIRISRMSDRRYEFCLGLHELNEAMLCKFQGISQKQVDDFDIPYEAAHAAGEPSYPCGCKHQPLSGPGDDKHAPYGFQHKIAGAIELIALAMLGVSLNDYDAEVDKPPE